MIMSSRLHLWFLFVGCGLITNSPAFRKRAEGEEEEKLLTYKDTTKCGSSTLGTCRSEMCALPSFYESSCCSIMRFIALQQPSTCWATACNQLLTLFPKDCKMLQYPDDQFLSRQPLRGGSGEASNVFLVFSNSLQDADNSQDSAYMNDDILQNMLQKLINGQNMNAGQALSSSMFPQFKSLVNDGFGSQPNLYADRFGGQQLSFEDAVQKLISSAQPTVASGASLQSPADSTPETENDALEEGTGDEDIGDDGDLISADSVEEPGNDVPALPPAGGAQETVCDPRPCFDGMPSASTPCCQAMRKFSQELSCWIKGCKAAMQTDQCKPFADPQEPLVGQKEEDDSSASPGQLGDDATTEEDDVQVTVTSVEKASVADEAEDKEDSQEPSLDGDDSAGKEAGDDTAGKEDDDEPLAEKKEEEKEAQDTKNLVKRNCGGGATTTASEDAGKKAGDADDNAGEEDASKDVSALPQAGEAQDEERRARLLQQSLDNEDAEDAEEPSAEEPSAEDKEAQDTKNLIKRNCGGGVAPAADKDDEEPSAEKKEEDKETQDTNNLIKRNCGGGVATTASKDDEEPSVEKKVEEKETQEQKTCDPSPCWDGMPKASTPCCQEMRKQSQELSCWIKGCEAAMKTDQCKSFLDPLEPSVEKKQDNGLCGGKFVSNEGKAYPNSGPFKMGDVWLYGASESGWFKMASVDAKGDVIETRHSYEMVTKCMSGSERQKVWDSARKGGDYKVEVVFCNEDNPSASAGKVDDSSDEGGDDDSAPSSEGEGNEADGGASDDLIVAKKKTEDKDAKDVENLVKRSCGGKKAEVEPDPDVEFKDEKGGAGSGVSQTSDDDEDEKGAAKSEESQTSDGDEDEKGDADSEEFKTSDGDEDEEGDEEIEESKASDGDEDEEGDEESEEGETSDGEEDASEDVPGVLPAGEELDAQRRARLLKQSLDTDDADDANQEDDTTVSLIEEEKKDRDAQEALQKEIQEEAHKDRMLESQLQEEEDMELEFQKNGKVSIQEHVAGDAA
eukprot:TRINITY_DN1566_c0_g1_i4.p1 TRINITY_DN1566_c0_g1~~TRINITY_DN1566_c0_g1_i4.p1  ORF type:complete len:1018 (-),score=296.14 TRINITY_DN1566_c0_g1_i4:217-3270(-)